MSSINQKEAIADHPLASLPREDLDLVVEFVLRSGSLKDLADAYNVSYPTIRLRLDRLIERLQAAVKGQKIDPLNELVAKLVASGELTSSGARAIRDMARKSASNDKTTKQNQSGGA